MSIFFFNRECNKKIYNILSVDQKYDGPFLDSGEWNNTEDPVLQPIKAHGSYRIQRRRRHVPQTWNLMLIPVHLRSFERDIEKAKNRGLDIPKIKAVMIDLIIPRTVRFCEFWWSSEWSRFR